VLRHARYNPVVRLSKRASALLTLAIGLAAVVALALTVRDRVGFSDWYVVKSASAFLAVMLFVATLVERYHPFPRFGPANQITALRALFTSLVAGRIGEPSTAAVAASLVSAGIVVALLDGADGWVARRALMQSRFGARFDMEVDALLILALSILSFEHDKAGWWVLASGLLRYGFVAAAWQWSWLAFPLPPSRRRQTICVVQIVGLLIVLSPVVHSPASAILAGVCLAVLACSFFVDTLWLWRRRMHATRDLFPGNAAEGTKPAVP